LNYPELPGLTWEGTLYYNKDMETIEALIPTGGYATAHAPALLELPNGDLLCCWFAAAMRAMPTFTSYAPFCQRRQRLVASSGRFQ